MWDNVTVSEAFTVQVNHRDGNLNCVLSGDLFILLDILGLYL